MDTRESILLAASKEFAEHGYHATTMRKIAARAGINHAAINYHFSSKALLYKNVIRFLLDKDELDKQPVRDIEDEDEWRQAISDWIYRALSSMIAGSDPVIEWKEKIFYREMYDDSGLFPEIFRDHIQPKLNPIVHYISLGLPKDSEDEIFIALFSILAQIMFYANNKLAIELISDGRFPFRREDKIKKIAAYMTKQLCNSLCFRDNGNNREER